MPDYCDHGNYWNTLPFVILLIVTIVPEYPVSTRCMLLRVSFKDISSISS